MTCRSRFGELLRWVPTIPLWMGLAALPPVWSMQKRYFMSYLIVNAHPGDPQHDPG